MDPQSAQALLREIEFGVVEAFDDPSRRSISGNIMRYAVDLGVDLSDSQNVQRYINWYNNLPHAERTELSDTGRLASPSMPFAPNAPLGNVVQAAFGSHFTHEDEFWDEDDHDEVFDVLSDHDLDLTSAWPRFLGELPDPDAPVLPPDPALLQAEYETNEFVQRARTLLTLIGNERKLTETGALNRADTSDALSNMGIETKFRSMWEIPEIVGPWMALSDGGWIRIERRRVSPGPGMAPAAPPAFDPEGFADFAHLLLSRLLLSLSINHVEEGGFANMPDTFQALLVASRPGGLVLPDISELFHGNVPEELTDPETEGMDLREVRRLVDTQRDLAALARYGVLRMDGATYQAPNIVRSALGTVLSVLNELALESD